MKKVRTYIKHLVKVRSLLQQEINSVCPFCSSSEVGHFQIHHIDENPQNNELSNLILLCPTCHSKITKGDISQNQVRKHKNELQDKLSIEIASIGIDSNNCSWENNDGIENAFINRMGDKSAYPIINFTIINHSPKTIIFKAIELKVKHLFSGLSGIPVARVLKPIATFKIQIPLENESTQLGLLDEIEVPSKQAFKFQVQVYEHWNNEDFPIDGKMILYFIFKFNAISISAPDIFLNCKSDNEGINVYRLH